MAATTVTRPAVRRTVRSARVTRAARLPPPARREDRVDGGDRRLRRRAGPPGRRRRIRRGPAYAYTIGFPAHVGFPEVAVFGLTPVAARGLLGLVADARLGGTEIPLDVELVGLLDNELRCRFSPIDLGQWGGWFATAAAWYRGEPFEVVQLIYPDRNGFLPVRGGVRAAHAARPAGDRIRRRTDRPCYPSGSISSGPATGPATWVNAPKVPPPTGGMWPERSGNPGVRAARDASSDTPATRRRGGR